VVIAPYASYRLTEAEIEKAARQARRSQAQHGGIPCGKDRTGESFFVAERTNFGGEIALAALTNGTWQPNDEQIEGSVDVVLGDGRTLDAKTNRYKTHTLLMVKWSSSSKADLYVLMVVIEFPCYEYRGWEHCAVVRTSRWWQPSRYADPCWVVPQVALQRYLVIEP
jgi:hypothetical protein